MITNTLYRISSNILAICDDHLMIDYVAQGTLDQIDENVAFTGRTAWLIHQDSSLEEGAVFHNFNLILLDVELPDRSNADQIQSDMLQVGIDIIGKLNQVPINKAWVDLTNVTITPFEERFNDYVAGATVSFSVKALENFDVCSDTFAGSYIPAANGQFILQPTQYLTCTTLQECPAFIAVSQSAGGAQTPTGSLLVTASAQVGSNVITFTKGNGDTFNVTVATGSLSGFVPYQGATADVNLNTFALTGSAFQLSGATTGGKLNWNDTFGTGELTLKGGNVSVLIGQKQVVRVVNGTGGNLLGSNYQAVRVIGAQGQRLQVNLAQANNDPNSAATIGLVAENIGNNQEGFITTGGQIIQVDTTGDLQGESWSDGDTLYLSPTTAGALTNIKPQAPQHTVIIGFVEHKNKNNGRIFVKVDNGYELDELHNVRINTASLAPGDLLVRAVNNGGVWENSKQLTGSYAITGSLQATSFTGSFSGSFAGVVLTSQTSSMLAPYVLNSQTSSFVLNSQTSSFINNSQTSSMTVGTASFVTDPRVVTDLFNLTASVNIGNTLTATTASVGQFSLPANTASGSMVTISGFFSSTANTNTKTVVILINDNAATVALAAFTGGLQFTIPARVINSTTIRFYRLGGTITTTTAPSFADITSVGGVWALKTSTSVNTGSGPGITNTLEALTIRI